MATSSHSLEREDSDSEASSDSDPVRCLPNGLGCSVRWCEYRRLMVPTVRGYANPPWCIIGRVLNKIRAQKAQVVLVAPVWKGQD